MATDAIRIRKGLVCRKVKKGDTVWLATESTRNTKGLLSMKVKKEDIGWQQRLQVWEKV